MKVIEFLNLVEINRLILFLLPSLHDTIDPLIFFFFFVKQWYCMIYNILNVREVKQ